MSSVLGIWASEWVPDPKTRNFSSFLLFFSLDFLDFPKLKILFIFSNLFVFFGFFLPFVSFEVASSAEI